MKANSILNEEMQGQKLTNFLAGYVLALAALFVALEYSQREVKVIDVEPVYQNRTEEDMIPITFNQEVMSPPPAAAPTVAEYINVVDDKIDLLEDEIISPEEINQSISWGPNAPAIIAPGPYVEESDDEIINVIVPIPEVDARFPGDVNKWLSEHIKYPYICLERGIQGRVIVSFVVETDGSITDIQVVRSPSADSNKDLGTEAIRVVQMMPKWIPARQGNKPVRSRFNLPVMFRLN